MSKSSKRPRRVLSPRGATTGSRECRECFAPAYSHHAKNCPKAE